MITIYAVGKIKEAFYRQAAQEYQKRLGRYDKIRIIEVADERIPEHTGPSLEELIRKKEGERLEKQFRSGSYLIALAIDGEQMSSVKFAEKIASLRLYGAGDIGFIIGGSLGLPDFVLKRADARISFSVMTFPHQLMRVILLEQIYRAEKILAGEPYHK